MIYLKSVNCRLFNSYGEGIELYKVNVTYVDEKNYRYKNSFYVMSTAWDDFSNADTYRRKEAMKYRITDELDRIFNKYDSMLDDWGSLKAELMSSKAREISNKAIEGHELIVSKGISAFLYPSFVK